MTVETHDDRKSSKKTLRTIVILAAAGLILLSLVLIQSVMNDSLPRAPLEMKKYRISVTPNMDSEFWTEPIGINNHGQVAGKIWKGHYDVSKGGFLWDPNEEKMWRFPEGVQQITDSTIAAPNIFSTSQASELGSYFRFMSTVAENSKSEEAGDAYFVVESTSGSVNFHIPNATDVRVVGISDNGRLAGSYEDTTLPIPLANGFIFDSRLNILELLERGVEPAAINSQGSVVGKVGLYRTVPFIRLADGEEKRFPELKGNGSGFLDINNHNVAVGMVTDPSIPERIYDRIGEYGGSIAGVLHHLMNYLGYSNSEMLVKEYSAILYMDGSVYNLSSILSERPEWDRVIAASGINDKKEIVGVARDKDGNLNGFVMRLVKGE